MIHTNFIKYIVNTIIWKYIKGSKRYDILKDMKINQWNNLEINRKIQKKKLFDLIDYACKNVPYYRKLNISYSCETIFEDIKMFPILDKKILKESFDDLKSEFFDKKYYKNTSGGSTGEPAVFLQDQNYHDNTSAVKELYYEWADRKEGEYMIMLWGSERDIIKGGQGINGFLQRIMMNVQVLNAFKMGDTNMDEYTKIINNKKPIIIESYVQSAYELAKYIKKFNKKINFPKGIIVSAGTLYPEMKKIIQEIFGCNIFNRYGSREVGDMAMNCEKDEGLHLNTFNQYIEILDDDLNPTKPGKIGNVYVTSLNNFIMPLIRYEIGDLAVPSEKKQCSCGRGLPLIEKIEGRVGSLIKTKKGIIDSTAMTTSFYFYSSIDKYQFIQNTIDNITLKVVVNDENLWENDKIKLSDKLIKILGNEVIINFEVVDDIENMKSGKYAYFISYVK